MNSQIYCSCFYNKFYLFKTKNPERKTNGVFKIKIGDYLLSHTLAHAVPSACKVLTTLFGMGRGVSP